MNSVYSRWSSFEQYKKIMKQAHKQTSQRSGTCINETLSKVERQLDRSEVATDIHILEMERNAKASKRKTFGRRGYFGAR